MPAHFKKRPLCIICGTATKASNRKLCSYHCSTVFRHRLLGNLHIPVDIHCVVCGKIFQVEPSARTRRACSRTCGTKVRMLTSNRKHLSSSGYVMASDINSKRRHALITPEHRLIAEKAVGFKLDSRHPVHHHDEDKAHNANANLVICEDSGYHRLLHARMRILKVGGNPNTDCICASCKALKPLTDFNKSKSRTAGHDAECRQCKSVRSREQYARSL